MSKKNPTEADLKAMGLVPDGKGGFVKSKTPMLDKALNQVENTTHFNVKVIPQSPLTLGRPSMQPTNEIFIAGEVMSSKNSRRNFGHTSLVSEACAKYKKESATQWQTWQAAFLAMCQGKEKPYRVQFKFVRKTKRAYDFHNMVQVLCDLMVDYKWVDDDNIYEMVPVPPLTGPIFTISKTNPGVYISVL